ncbi:MAG: hypothetical protein QOE63_1784 [Acidimicrobiaceae bacterium]
MERVEVLDERGKVIDVVARDAMRARNLRHRAVYIAVLDGNRVLTHHRAAWKDVWPSRWDVAFGGVCDVGESWPAAALRELAEEAGIAVGEHELLDMGDDRFESDEVRLVGRIFAVQHAGPFAHPDGEVQSTAWVQLPDLDAWLAQHDVVDDSRAIVVPRLRH